MSPPDPALAEAASLLPGARFADRFSVFLPGSCIEAGEAARRIFASTPKWIVGLMALRDRLVRPFDLKTRRRMAGDQPRAAAGWFPILSQSPERVVLGTDDRHLDFRLVLETVAVLPEGTRVSGTTIVRTHNLLGRVYLAAVMPFHKIIVPAMLRRVLR
ncbi:DUF2867 domain-containing protein [Nitratireductor soli]|uniref:DUF2867 domain-containing protein n=1 Tax=Nitratireductor soli TaxID=1670619 RepID=UPI00065E5C23|nr:DUF2867 domain-containing protein [Nitratireductor soli]